MPSLAAIQSTPLPWQVPGQVFDLHHFIHPFLQSLKVSIIPILQMKKPKSRDTNLLRSQTWVSPPAKMNWQRELGLGPTTGTKGRPGLIRLFLSSFSPQGGAI
jgi:hypothetical protein